MLTRRQLEDAAKCGSLKCKDCSIGKDIEICVERTAETALALADMVERLEWVEVGDREGEREMIPDILCPSCDNWKEEGHAADCELAALLKGLEGSE